MFEFSTIILLVVPLSFIWMVNELRSGAFSCWFMHDWTTECGAFYYAFNSIVRLNNKLMRCGCVCIFSRDSRRKTGASESKWSQKSPCLSWLCVREQPSRLWWPGLITASCYGPQSHSPARGPAGGLHIHTRALTHALTCALVNAAHLR